MTFPSNPNDDDLHEAFGRRLRYRSGKWQVVSSPTVATVTEEAPKTEAVAQAVDLPMTGNEIGAMAYVQESNRLYVWNGSGWFEVALVNTNPTITAGGNATYELAPDGTPTVVTLTANDPEGLPLTWSYAVTSGALGGTTVTNVDNVFTITPSTNSVDAGTFQLTFTASDGVNVDTSASSFILEFAPNWSIATLTYTVSNPNAYDTNIQDYFGNAVAVSGDYAIVGAYFEDDANGANGGVAYIFNATTGTLVHTLVNPNPYSTSSNDRFAASVAINGNYAIVGAYQEDTANGTSSGKAYIFNVTTGSLVRTLNNPNTYGGEGGDYFGYSVALTETYAIVGAYGESDASGANSGRVYIFNLTNGALVRSLVNPTPYATGGGDVFGFSISVDGNYIIVGAYGEGDDAGGQVGKAYIYNLSTGALVHTLSNPNPSSTDRFGYSVAISGDYAIVGASQEDFDTNDNSGKAYIYNVNTGALFRTLDNPNSYGTRSGDNFGLVVAISGNYAFVGTPLEDFSSQADSGKVYIFDITTGALVKTLNNPNSYDTYALDQFGYALAVDGKYLIAGTPYEDAPGGTQLTESNSGKVYIYQSS